MITETYAADFAKKWIDAFNSHDLDRILSHYDDEIEFYSPFILALRFNDEGLIKDKADLRRYFSLGLNAYPDLHFVLAESFAGVNTVLVRYTSVQNKQAAECFELNEKGLAVKVYCHY